MENAILPALYVRAHMFKFLCDDTMAWQQLLCDILRSLNGCHSQPVGLCVDNDHGLSGVANGYSV